MTEKFILLVKQYNIISRYINVIDLTPKQLCNKQNIKGKYQRLTFYSGQHTASVHQSN